jgi:hypothetical protein
MSERPQEWTGDTVRGLLPHENPCWIEEEGSRTYLSDKDLEPIARAHNAALAATYEQHHTELWRQCERLRDQLAAAEREELDVIKEGLAEHGYTFTGNIADATLHFIQQLKQQLAAREKGK